MYQAYGHENTGHAGDCTTERGAEQTYMFEGTKARRVWCYGPEEPADIAVSSGPTIEHSCLPKSTAAGGSPLSTDGG
jgi:hypothetical protein